jgi:hypothetical protein
MQGHPGFDQLEAGVEADVAPLSVHDPDADFLTLILETEGLVRIVQVRTALYAAFRAQLFRERRRARPRVGRGVRCAGGLTRVRARQILEPAPIDPAVYQAPQFAPVFSAGALGEASSRIVVNATQTQAPPALPPPRPRAAPPTNTARRNHCSCSLLSRHPPPRRALTRGALRTLGEHCARESALCGDRDRAGLPQRDGR